MSAQAARDKAAQLQTARQGQAATLNRRDEIEAAVREMDAVRAERQALTPRLAAQADWTRRISELKAETQAFLADSRVRIGNLKAQLETAQK